VDLEWKRGEDIEEENRGPARPLLQARWKITGVLGLGFIPNRHEKKKTNKKIKQPSDPTLLKHKKDLGNTG
jgi:hypothetical protein